ncbi:Protein of unknown function [Zunongwangia mangrovi]|uniref:DUF3892 domain-containing protein n=1 Tax=Zunongwangia mangrovi TaxID=1334022 RepID=A0A1I1DGT2_9FLAO|nr:DUF3892 domain-containing protein [Zunongwangia mangrovi]SFB71743.1 Protein of unknown function [Zunongwangia mangrovi]
MAQYRISGVWKNSEGVITHYAFHEKKSNSVSFANKVDKSYAIQLLENPNNSAYTWIWNYNLCKWKIGEEVKVVNGNSGKYLRSNPDKTETNNLEHLIDYDWLRYL